MHWVHQVWGQQRLRKELQDGANLQLTKPKRTGVLKGRGVPWLHEPFLSLHSSDIPLHAFCQLPYYNAQANKAARYELVCSALHQSLHAC